MITGTHRSKTRVSTLTQPARRNAQIKLNQFCRHILTQVSFAQKLLENLSIFLAGPIRTVMSKMSGYI